MLRDGADAIRAMRRAPCAVMLICRAPTLMLFVMFRDVFRLIADVFAAPCCCYVAIRLSIERRLLRHTPRYF